MQGGVRRHSPIIVNSKSPRWDLKLEHGDTPRRTRPFGAPFLRIPEKEWRQILVQGIDVTVMSSTFRRRTTFRRCHSYSSRLQVATQRHRTPWKLEKQRSSGSRARGNDAAGAGGRARRGHGGDIQQPSRIPSAHCAATRVVRRRVDEPAQTILWR
jgi:hypothetical protein